MGFTALSMNPESIATFWSRVDRSPDGGCWVWQGYRDKDGYGLFKTGGVPRRAHRLALELGSNRMLGDLHACHSCDNPPCCNPAHLWAGTCLENRRDSVAKDRANRSVKNAGWQGKLTHCKNGHEWSEDNTRMYRGKRKCRACARSRSRLLAIKEQGGDRAVC